MPLLDPHSEFAAKWINLCGSHLKEGIREPVTACEFMGHFYIVEGNKRVSVLKYFDAPLYSRCRNAFHTAQDKGNRQYYLL